MSETSNEWVSTTWDMIDAAVETGGYKEGFVKVFLEFRGAVLDDMPLDAKGRPEVVNQSNFPRHFGIAISTFHRWLTMYGGPEFVLEGERAEKAEAAKGRQKTKAKKKDKAAAAHEVRTKVPATERDFQDKLAVRIADDEHWFIDVHQLMVADLPGREKERAAEKWLNYLDEEAEAIEQARAPSSFLTEHATTNGTAAA